MVRTIKYRDSIEYRDTFSRYVSWIRGEKYLVSRNTTGEHVSRDENHVVLIRVVCLLYSVQCAAEVLCTVVR